jgi:predicted DNA-binding transcriptional regulator
MSTSTLTQLGLKPYDYETRLYTAIDRECKEAHGRVTFSDDDVRKHAGIKSRYLFKKTRDRLVRMGLLEAHNIGRGIGYVYETKYPLEHISEKRRKFVRDYLNHVDKDSRKVNYTSAQLETVGTLFCGHAPYPTTTDELIYDCPFCGAKESFYVTAWLCGCKNNTCDRNGEPRGYTGQFQFHDFAAAIKLHHDQPKTAARVGLLMLPQHSRQIIAQIIKGRQGGELEYLIPQNPSENGGNFHKWVGFFDGVYRLQ